MTISVVFVQNFWRQINHYINIMMNWETKEMILNKCKFFWVQYIASFCMYWTELLGQFFTKNAQNIDHSSIIVSISNKWKKNTYFSNISSTFLTLYIHLGIKTIYIQTSTYLLQRFYSHKTLRILKGEGKSVNWFAREAVAGRSTKTSKGEFILY